MCKKVVAAEQMSPGHEKEDTHGEANGTTTIACADGCGAGPNQRGGNDVVQGLRGPDKIRGGNDKDKQYGGRGNDVIYTEGGFRDLVNGGKGTDTCYVDSKDRVVGCEKRR
jgi:Ca2+-binding RTX toxin-like protein